MIYASESGDIRMVAVGDVMLTRGLTPFQEPDYLKVVELVRGGDVGFFNMETTVREPHEGCAIPSQGTLMTTPPALLPDLKWMGFNLCGTANNHATDYGEGGVLAQLGHLRRANLAFAGTGATLGQARAPGYVDTRMGRVACVAATSFFPLASSRAADPRPDAAGRPGVSALGFTRTYTIDDEAMATLGRIRDGLGLSAQARRRAASFFSKSEAGLDDGDSLTFLDAKFRRGNGFAVGTAYSKRDAEQIFRQIREARRQADWVVFSFHNHEEAVHLDEDGPDPEHERDEPAGFAIDFARAVIDAGADMVAGSGAHMPMGVEVYKGKPIMYSLGNFVMQNDTVDSVPADAYARFDLPPESTPADFLDARTGNDSRGFPASFGYWTALLAECEWKARRLAAFKLHPIDLGFRLSRAQRGRPVVAHGEVAQRILSRLQKQSQRLGVRVEIEGEVGVVRLA